MFVRDKMNNLIEKLKSGDPDFLKEIEEEFSSFMAENTNELFVISKPEIPNFVFDWVQENKDKYYSNLRLILNDDNLPDEIYNWITKRPYLENQYALAILLKHGEEAVKVVIPKKYKVKIVTTGQYLYRTLDEELVFSKNACSHFTEDELYTFGYYEAFDSSIFEVIEVD